MNFAVLHLTHWRAVATTFFVLGWLSAIVAASGGALAQTPTPLEITGVAPPADSCPAPGSTELATAAATESPYYDYVILLDVSGSMVGMYGDPATYDASKDIFADVKASLKGYVADLQPGSMVYIVPFGNPVDPSRVRQFGIDQEAPDGGVAEALAYVDSLIADNDRTHITSSVNYALDMLNELRKDDDREHIQTILLYTDGIGNGPEDSVDGQASVANLIDALREFRQEQPYLFVKYVSLGVEVPDREILEQNGVEVVEQVEGVPPVREVRLAVVPDDLGPLAPGEPAFNRLCATSGDLGDGITLLVNDDPSALPPDVQLAFRAQSTTLDEAGIPLTYTLATRPASGAGPFTTRVEVQPEDQTVFLVPSRLPVTFSAAPTPTPTPTWTPTPSPTSTPTPTPTPTPTWTPTPIPPTQTPTPVPPTPTPTPVPPTPTPTPIPAGMLAVGEFPEKTVVRGIDQAGGEWPLLVELQARDGGEVTLRVDRSRLDATLPQPMFGFELEDGSLSDTTVLNAGQPRATLVLEASQDVLETLPDGRQAIPADIVVDPGATELTISGAAMPHADGTLAIPVPAPLDMQPTPKCSIEVGDATAQSVTTGDTSNDPVQWEVVVDLDGQDGCAGEVTYDDSAIQETISGARATFIVNGEERASLPMTDERLRAFLVVTAPRSEVVGLGTGEHTLTVDLNVTAVRSVVDLPDGAIDNGGGSFTLSVPLSVTVSEQPLARCLLPLFTEQEVVLDETAEQVPPFDDEVACTASGGAAVTFRITKEDPGVSAHFITEGGEQARSVTLDAATPAAKITLEVNPETAQRLGAGRHEFAVEILARAEPDSAVLEVEGETPGESGEVTTRVVALVNVVEPPPPLEIVLKPIPLTPDVYALETRDTSPDPLVWRGDLNYELLNGAEGTVSVDEATLPEGVSASLQVAEMPLTPPVPLAGQPGAIELVVQVPLATALALGPGDHELPIAIVLDPQGAAVRASGAARDGDTYRLGVKAHVSIDESKVVLLTPPTFDEQKISTVPEDDTPVDFTAQIPYEVRGGSLSLRVDDAELRTQFPTAQAVLRVDGEDLPEVNLPESGHDVELVITAPISAFEGEDTYTLTVHLVAQGDGAFLTVGDETFEPGVEVSLPVQAELMITAPRIQIDWGEWEPAVLEVPSTGTGKEPVGWRRTITASGLEDGARPTLSVSEEPGRVADLTTILLYKNEVSEDNLLAEGDGAQPVTATFAPGQETIIVVVEAAEDKLREFELSDGHQLDVTLRIDPNGAVVEDPSTSASSTEPIQEKIALRVKVYEPFNLMALLLRLAPVLLAVVAVLVLYLLWPGLPADAAVSFDGGMAPLPRGGATIGRGAEVDIGSDGPFGEIKGRLGGRRTGAAKFVAAVPIIFDGETIEPGKSVNILPDDKISGAETRDEFTYVRDSSLSNGDEPGNHDGETLIN